MEAWLHSLLGALALPQYGLSTVFVVAMLSATLLPMGSEPAVFGLVKLNPDVLAGRAGGHRRQHVGRCHQLVDGLRRRTHLRAHQAQARRANCARCTGCSASAPRPAC
jgi:hypothetical protein